MSVRLPKIAKLRHIFRSKSPSKYREQNLVEGLLQEFNDNNPTAESLFKLALVKLLKGDLDTGYKILGESLEKDSSSTVRNLALNIKRKVFDAVRLMKIGDGLVGEEKYEKAILKYKESLLIFRDFPAIQCKIHRFIIDAVQLFDRNDRRILEHCSKVLEYEKHNIQMLRTRSEIYRKEDRVLDYLHDLTHLNLLMPSDGQIAVDLEKTRRVGITCDPDSYYELLRLSPDCNMYDIEKAYKKYRLLCQPDRFADDPWFQEKAVIKMKALEKAFHVLKDEDLRNEYDTSRFNLQLQIRKRQNSNSRLDHKAKQGHLERGVMERVNPRQNLSDQVSHLRKENYILISRVNNLKADLNNCSLSRKKNLEIIKAGKKNVIELKSKMRVLEKKVKLREMECKLIQERESVDVSQIKDIFMLESLRKRFEDRLKEITNQIHGINNLIHKRIEELRAKEKQCSICMDRAYDTALLHCGHVGCSKCFTGILECPFCRTNIQGKLRLYGM